MKKTLILHKGNVLVHLANKYYGSVAKTLNFNSKSILELGVLYYDSGSNKTSASMKKEWLESEKNYLNQYDYICVSDAEYFKILAKQTKADNTLGTLFDSTYTTAKVIYIPPTTQQKYDPVKFSQKVSIVFQAILSDIAGTYTKAGSDIVHSEYYPRTIPEIESALIKLLDYPSLAVDIEAKSLQVTQAGIYTIAFAWDKHNGIAFPVDAGSEPSKIKALLRQFFDTYKGKLIVHKGNYDISVLVYELYMQQNFNNRIEQVNGIKTLCKNLDDTLLITYLATNSCSGNILGLKELAAEYAGDWAVDVSDVTKVPLDELLKYNLVDVLSTNYVYEMYYPRMVQDDQESIYKKHFLPYLQDCIRMQLNGLPISIPKVEQLENNLQQEKDSIIAQIGNLSAIKTAQIRIAEKEAEKRNSKYKKKRVTWNDCYTDFNFRSTLQLTLLLYEVMQLPVISLTDAGNPSVDNNTLNKLQNHTENQEYKTILRLISELNDVDKILSGFIPAFKNAGVDKLGNTRLTGYFNFNTQIFA